MPQPDPTAIEQWLDRLYDNFDEGEWLTLFALDRSDGSRHVDWLDIGDYDAIVDRAFKRAERCDVWHGVATRRERQVRGRGTAADCAHLPGLWLDVDIAGAGHLGGHALPPDVDAARELILDFPEQPSAVVHSGGGLQAWWLFEEPHPAGAADELLARWGATWARLGRQHGWHVDNVFDVARVMRLPGTLNRKLDEPRPVVMIEHSEHRYGPSDIAERLDEPPVPTSTAQPARTPHIGPERPGDAYNARHAAGELLSAHGWTLASTDRNGDEQWTRPGKDRRQGSSATVYAEDGHTTIWSDTAAAMHGLDVRRPYDPFALFTHIEHGGDWTAAREALAGQGYGAPTDSDLMADLRRVDTVGRSAGGQDGQDARDDLAPPDETDDDPDAAPGSSWRRTRLAEIVRGLDDGTLDRPHPTVGRFRDGSKSLYYVGRVNGLYGESGKGKSWIALALADEVMSDGGSVAWIDLEEPPEGTVQRLLDLGQSVDAIVERFMHFAPEETIGRGAALFDALDAQPPALVVIDSTGEALAVEKAGPNNDDEVAAWFQTWARRLARRYPKACVVVVDHVVKDQQTRGYFPSGSQRKRAAITGSAFMVDTASKDDGLGKDVLGWLKLTCAKDRHGTFRQGQQAARFALDGTVDPTAWWIDPPLQSKAADPEAKRKAQVWQWVNAAAEPQSKNDIDKAVEGTRTLVFAAVDWLVEHGYLEGTDERYPRYRSLKPYPEERDPDDLMKTICGDPDA